MTLADTVPADWRALLESVLHTPEARRLSRDLQEQEQAGKAIFPPQDQRLAALALTPPAAVKVVILGQDPYHGRGQANGLAFSVNPGLRIPPSLVNIFKELNRDLGLTPPPHGDLSHWARQGVLLLNNALTVEEGHAGSHQKIGWEAITDAIVAAVALQDTACVFLLWGSHAQKKAARIPHLRAGPHLVLNAPHPSPLSAHRGFLGCAHFSQANAFLESRGRTPIDWRVTSPADR